jgi:hypothetical protein
VVLANQRLKRMANDYDLISGNVHEVRYQYGRKDQMSHRYEYDADNRMDIPCKVALIITWFLLGGPC